MQSIAIEWLFAAPFGHLSRWRYAGASVLRCITLLPICISTRQTIPPLVYKRNWPLFLCVLSFILKNTSRKWQLFYLAITVRTVLDPAVTSFVWYVKRRIIKNTRTIRQKGYCQLLYIFFYFIKIFENNRVMNMRYENGLRGMRHLWVVVV